MEIGLSKRYHSNVGELVQRLQSHAELSKTRNIQKIEKQRQIHKSCAQMNTPKSSPKTLFNNKTKQGEFFTRNPPQIPYLFIPKFKNETFIMPDRVFEKGKKGKRFSIKMKDTFVLSFRDEETERYRKITNKEQKDKIITNRKLQQLNRILIHNDGRERAKRNKWQLKNNKIFGPPSNIQCFDLVSPMLSPRDSQTVLTKKITLSKTQGTNSWKPVSSTTELFNRTKSSLGEEEGLCQTYR